jgi:hypothetical protein
MSCPGWWAVSTDVQLCLDERAGVRVTQSCMRTFFTPAFAFSDFRIDTNINRKAEEFQGCGEVCLDNLCFIILCAMIYFV